MSTNYVNLIDQYLVDVADASYQRTVINSVDTQYYDYSTGYILNSSQFVGGAIDSDPVGFDCYDPYTDYCVTYQDLEEELAYVMSYFGWQASPTSLFFIFTPYNVGSCDSSGACAYSAFCGYYTWSSNWRWSFIAFPTTPYNGTACTLNQYPNGDWADSAINIVSHEQNEAITDPSGSAWYDVSGPGGGEIGDKCAWDFGPILGYTSYGAYDEVMDGDPYYIQQEWSNAAYGCGMSYSAATSTPTPTFTPTQTPTSTPIPTPNRQPAPEVTPRDPDARTPAPQARGHRQRPAAMAVG